MSQNTYLIIAAVLLLGPLYLRWLAGMISAGIRDGLRPPPEPERKRRPKRPLTDNEKIQAEFEKRSGFSEDRAKLPPKRQVW